MGIVALCLFLSCSPLMTVGSYSVIYFQNISATLRYFAQLLFVFLKLIIVPTLMFRSALVWSACLDDTHIHNGTDALRVRGPHAVFLFKGKWSLPYFCSSSLKIMCNVMASFPGMQSMSSQGVGSLTCKHLCPFTACVTLDIAAPMEFAVALPHP